MHRLSDDKLYQLWRYYVHREVPTLESSIIAGRLAMYLRARLWHRRLRGGW